jgi:hypothetical protein
MRCRAFALLLLISRGSIAVVAHLVQKMCQLSCLNELNSLRVSSLLRFLSRRNRNRCKSQNPACVDDDSEEDESKGGERRMVVEWGAMRI